MDKASLTLCTRPPPSMLSIQWHNYVDRLPTEIWLNCFTFCRLSQLRRLVLVCRYFRALAQPLLFRHQRIETPYRISMTRPCWISTTRSIHRTGQIITRLAASTHASSVRSWHFSGYGGQMDLPRNITNIQLLWDTWLRVRQILETTLGAYQRLTTLHLEYLTIDEAFRATLASLPLLADLTLATCEIPARSGALLPLRKFVVTGPRREERTSVSDDSDDEGTSDAEDEDHDEPESEDVLEIVSPNTLRCLTLEGWPECTAVLAALARQALPNLTHLSVHLHELNADLFLNCLDVAPRLESVDLQHRDSDVPTMLPAQLPDSSIPALTTFTGTQTLAGLFMSSRPVVEVTLHPYASGTAAFNEILPALRDISGTARTLHRLTISEPIPFTEIHAVFGAIGATFPELHELTTHLRDPSRAPDDDLDEEDAALSFVDSEIDDRMVELPDDDENDESFTSLRCESYRDWDFHILCGGWEPRPVPDPILPGCMYDPEASAPTPPALDFPAPTESNPDNALHILIRALSSGTIALPPHLEVLRFTQPPTWDPPAFPLADQHRAILLLERRLTALREVAFAADREGWVRDREVWTRNYSSVPLVQAQGFVRIGSLVWKSDGTRI
ncbi:hypothetical protein FB451DRAFT_1372293 [Mycena latifolia]|nr:hypothetical protein FB451DRAFT_1372293 [Mycena latifolia]